MSIGIGVVPSAWRPAVITPMPKCAPASGVSEFITVNRYLLSCMVAIPAIPSNDVIDQYGFKPTGSTTATLVDLTNGISVLSKNNKYVRYLIN